jgi:3-oxoacyl-[acyl-carrier-protein] synthase III
VPAFINGFGVCLPNKPVPNQQIESILGMVGRHPSPVRDVILERNGIKWRYYALDPQSGNPTHCNAELTVEAIRALAAATGLDLGEIDLLACGTSSPDQAIPSHAAMVHGLLGGPAVEIVSTAGVCCSGIAAMKCAFAGVLAGLNRSAVVTGSELISPALKASQFEPLDKQVLSGDPYLAFNREFLRFMLSDGAGAVLIEDRPRPGQMPLRIDWLESRSYANELAPCMYSGALKATDGTLRSWRLAEANAAAAFQKGYFNLHQDVNLLSENIVCMAGRFFADVRQRRNLEAKAVRWLVPHISSMFFQQPLYEEMAKAGFELPPDRWFTNLKYKGNTGAASIFIMLEELHKSGKLQRGDTILCAIPESARFTYACLHLTVE